MLSNEIQDYRNSQKLKYLNNLENQKYEHSLKLLHDLGFLNNKKIIDNNLINKIQNFYRKYNLNSCICYNLYNIIDYKDEDIIKFRMGYKVYGYHYLDLLKHFNKYEKSNPYNGLPFEKDIYNIINKKIIKKNKFIFDKKSEYFSYQITNYYDTNEWDMNKIFLLFEQRGINSIKLPQSIFNQIVELPPSIYALEIITNNNINRSYASFQDFPIEYNIDFELPLGVYIQLKTFPSLLDIDIRIIEPPKGKKIGIKCMINNDNILNNVKNKLTSEFNKHKILSLNQIIIVESDINFDMIPFRIEYLEPSNVINIVNVDIEVDFLTSLVYTNAMESLLVELNN